MANITKLKRDKMLQFLHDLKKVHTDDASIRAFNEIENALLEKKFGLVFEEHTESVDEKLKEYIPVLCADKTRKICKDPNLPYNFIIEGDNLQALYLLEKTHKGKVDCIYIDPPYNTGAKDWKYNNDYVDERDAYRHSKWLSMMLRRLEKAKSLLKPDGVLICAIDENELGNLILLLKDCFGLNYHLDIVCIVHNPRGVQGDNFSYTNEYAIFVYPEGVNPIAKRDIPSEEVDWRDLRDNGHESLREDAATCFYSINVKDGIIIGFGDNKTDDYDFHPQRNVKNMDGSISVYPIDKKGIERKWRYSRESVEKIKHLLRVKNINGILDIELGKNFGTYRTVWVDKKYDSNEYGTKLINDIVPNNDFSYPKSLYNVYDCIRAVIQNRPNAIVVDFFAGSGTTGHAVLLANYLLQGTRRFILCTDNSIGYTKEKEFRKKYPQSVTKTEGPLSNTPEYKVYEEQYGIARSITWPRIQKVIQGYDSKIGSKAILFEQSLTPQILFNEKKFKDLKLKIENIKTAREKDFQEIKLSIDPQLMVVGISNKGSHVTGISANVKYFKCDWTPRKPQDYLLSNALCLHITEMIELQNAIEVDNVKNVILFNKEDYKKYIEDKTAFSKIENLWVNQNIIFDAKEIKKLQKKHFKYIPKEFFGQELMEAAE